jgi:hypothetical protein
MQILHIPVGDSIPRRRMGLFQDLAGSKRSQRITTLNSKITSFYDGEFKNMKELPIEEQRLF